MTITKEQLDELERKAKAALAASDYRCASWYPAFDIEDALDSYADAHHIAANSPDVTLQLVAIVRAAQAFVDADRRLQNAKYSIGDYDNAVEAVNGAADVIRSALRGTP